MPLLYKDGALEEVSTHTDLTRLCKKIDWLWDNRAVRHHSPLKENLAGFYKCRLSKYRIIYKFDPDADCMAILRVAPRESVYDLGT